MHLLGTKHCVSLQFQHNSVHVFHEHNNIYHLNPLYQNRSLTNP